MKQIPNRYVSKDIPLNLMLVGAGPHGRHFYIPAFERLRHTWNVHVRTIVELQSSEENLQAFVKRRELDCELIFVEPFESRMPEGVSKNLHDAVERHSISAVVIATDPLTHRVYAEWALSQGLHILMDKPISTRRDAVSDERQAAAIETDYLAILEAYQDVQRDKETCFVICAHRRFHPGISYVIEQIREVSGLTGCPVTNIHCYHCDGQWRMPAEIVTQYHHTYYLGYGKASHSGYHFFDCVYRFMKAGNVPGKEPDDLQLLASFIQPMGLLEQLNQDDYCRLFGSGYRDVHLFTDEELRQRYPSFGEVDVETIITFRRRATPMCNVSISLLHNGFSRRSWMHAPEDLYKGNGRVKHEQHRIHVGPFLGIQVHSYQAKDKHQKSGLEDLSWGGNNHFDVAIFRNVEMLGSGKPLEILRLADLEASTGFDETRLFIEQVKEGAILEFLGFIRGIVSKAELTSSIEDHFIPVQIMSGVYQSHNRRIRGANPLVVKAIQWRHIESGNTD